jgi:hypothetical protein
MLCHGISALGHLHRCAVKPALDHANQGLQIILNRHLTVAGGYMYAAAGIAEVYLTLCENGGDADSEMPPLVHARQICRAFAQYARRLPSYRPAALIMKGRLAHIVGRHRRARRLWSRAFKAAEQLHMHREMGRAMAALARLLSPSDPAHKERLLFARGLLDRSGATFEVQQIDQWLQHGRDAKPKRLAT